MITAEEFFRNKVKEQNPNREVITLSQELITAEQGMRWAHEFKQLHLHNVVGRSEQLKCFIDAEPKICHNPNKNYKDCKDCQHW
jgi:hypothetical protein